MMKGVCGLGVTGAILIGIAATARADINTVLIERALDEPAKIELQDVTLGDALEQMRRQIGVPVDLEAAQPAFNLLPYGQLSRIESAILQGITWREALGELLKPFALRFTVGDDRLYILGTDDLLRQPRRLNGAELEALVILQNTMLTNKSDNLLRQIRTETNIQFGLIVHGQRQDRVDPQDARALLKAQAAPATNVLTQYARRRFRRGEPATWYLRGTLVEGKTMQMDIVILSPAELYELKLQRRVSLNYQNIPVQQILLNLANKASVRLYFEPGCIAMVEPGLRDRFNMIGSSSTIAQAFEAISGMTGLTYSYSLDGIHIGAGENLKKSAANGIGGSSVELSNPTVCVLTVNIPGTDIETRVLLRENELLEAGVLEAYNQMVKKSVADFFDNLKQQASQAP